jgi:hypothetical protein
MKLGINVQITSIVALCVNLNLDKTVNKFNSLVDNLCFCSGKIRANEVIILKIIQHTKITIIVKKKNI